MIRRWLIFFAILLSGLTARVFAQRTGTVTGTVRSHNGAPLDGATVFLAGADSTQVISYASTDAEGRFRLRLPDGAASAGQLFIKVQLLGYASVIKPLSSGQSVFAFELTEASLMLKDVIVAGALPKVRARGDTTSYLVKAFAADQDRTIGEVLRRIPGITVEDNGLIKFNGKSIKRLYLDGDNLLDDKYNLGTRTIPQQLVDEVQVMENHQAIKALQDKIFSDDVDINLKFKKDARLKVVGEIRAGGGLPGLYDEEVNALSLKKNYKAISDLKLNNTGHLLTDDILSLNDQETRNKRGYTPDAAQLSSGTGSLPPLDQSRYTFNHSGLLSGANLWKLKSGLQVKAKAYGEYDRQQLNYQNLTRVFVPGDTVNYSELQNNASRNRNIHGDVTIENNRDHDYLINSLVFEHGNRLDATSLLANQVPLRQNYRQHFDEFANELKMINSPTGRLLTEFYSYIVYRNAPENLRIDSAVYPALFGLPTPVRNVTQQLNLPTFYTTDYLTLHVAAGQLTQSYKVGVGVKLQHFDSGLQAIGSQQQTLLPDSALNRLYWQNLQFFAEPGYEWHQGQLRITGKFPLALQYTGNNGGSVQDHTRFIFTPDITFRYNTNHGLSAAILYRRSVTAGNILQSYAGIVLNNYRTVSKNDNLFPVISSDNVGLQLNYKDPVKLFFINVSGNYILRSANNIGYSSINRQLSFTERKYMDNTNRTLYAQFNVSKYLFDLNTTVNAGYALQYAINNQVVNGGAYPFVNLQHSVSAGANGAIGKKIRFDYDLKYTFNNNKPGNAIRGAADFDATSATNALTIEYSATSVLFFKATATNQLNKNNSGLHAAYNFLDGAARYKIKKWRTDIEIIADNLMNVKYYQTVLLSGNTESRFNYPLRGRLILMKATFIF